MRLVWALLAGLLCAGAAVLTGCAGPGVGGAVEAVAPPPVVYELVDRARRRPDGGRRLMQKAAALIGGGDTPLASWRRIAGGRAPLLVLAGQGDAAPSPALLDLIGSRLAIIESENIEDATRSGGAVVAVARPVLAEGRFRGVAALLEREPPEGAVVLAVLDLQRLELEDGWSWSGGPLVAGADAIAVDRVALRILDSARRATGAPALEDGPPEGEPGLAALAWRKVAVAE